MQSDQPGVTGKTVRDAQFDRRVIAYWRVLVSLFMVISIVGIPFIPFWLIYSLWFGPKYFGGLSARLTTQALELRKGVFTRNESTIPLNRITDLKLHQGPLMRRFGPPRAQSAETAGQAGPQRQQRRQPPRRRRRRRLPRCHPPAAANHPWRRTLQQTPPGRPQPAGDATQLLTEIRDILARIEAKG